MPTIKKSYQHLRKRHKNKINVIRFTITAGLTLFDIISDLVLAVKYFINGDYWWGGLTLAFFILPFIIGVLFLWKVIPDLCGDTEDDDEDVGTPHQWWIIWKVFECIWEAGPQLILQLYIMALPAEASLSDRHNTTGENNLPKLILQHGMALYVKTLSTL